MCPLLPLLPQSSPCKYMGGDIVGVSKHHLEPHAVVCVCCAMDTAWHYSAHGSKAKQERKKKKKESCQSNTASSDAPSSVSVTNTRQMGGLRNRTAKPIVLVLRDPGGLPPGRRGAHCWRMLWLPATTNYQLLCTRRKGSLIAAVLCKCMYPWALESKHPAPSTRHPAIRRDRSPFASPHT